MVKHMVRTYKKKSMKIKRSGASYVHTSIESTRGITS